MFFVFDAKRRLLVVATLDRSSSQKWAGRGHQDAVPSRAVLILSTAGFLPLFVCLVSVSPLLSVFDPYPSLDLNLNP